jgi:hypothetical protein
MLISLDAGGMLCGRAGGAHDAASTGPQAQPVAEVEGDGDDGGVVVADGAGNVVVADGAGNAVVVDGAGNRVVSGAEAGGCSRSAPAPRPAPGPYDNHPRVMFWPGKVNLHYDTRLDAG